METGLGQIDCKEFLHLRHAAASWRIRRPRVAGVAFPGLRIQLTFGAPVVANGLRSLAVGEQTGLDTPATGEYARARGHTRRVGGVHVGEARALLRQAIKIRRCRPLVAVTAQVIPAQGVYVYVEYFHISGLLWGAL